VRRLGLAAASPLLSSAQLRVDLPKQALDKLEYLTRDADFGTVERATRFPMRSRGETARDRDDTRYLEPGGRTDLATGSKVESPLSKSGVRPSTFPPS